jgi:hypothetical protein
MFCGVMSHECVLDLALLGLCGWWREISRWSVYAKGCKESRSMEVVHIFIFFVSIKNQSRKDWSTAKSRIVVCVK